MGACSERIRPKRPRSPAVPVMVVQGAAFVALVGLSGSPFWLPGRVAVVILVTAGALGAWRLGPVVEGVVDLALAVLATATGIGIGLMHVAKSDIGVAAVTGLIVLVTGLLLLVNAGVTLVRATPGWWRLLAVPVAFLVLEFVLIPFTVAIYATNVPATELGTVTPASKGLAYRNVAFTTADGVRLSAWDITSANGAAVVLLHGAGSTRASVLDQAEVLADHGYGVLMVDARGHGRSGGDAMDLGWWGNRDTSAAVSWLERRRDVHDGRIAVVGISMGGEEAIGAAAADPRIRAVVAEGALGRGSMDSAWLPMDVQGVIERGMLAVQTAVAGLLTSAPTPTGLRSALIATAPRPVLLIAGKPELQADRSYQAATRSNVRLWELADTPHTGGLSKHRAEWVARVVRFLDSALGE